MPDMDGMALIRQLGENRYSGGVVIISEMEERVMSLAADLAKQHHTHLMGNVAKPFSVEQLESILVRLQAFLSKKTATQDLLSEQALINAIESNQIVPYYQPKINSKTNQVSSVELLARIVKPGEVDAILPERFIPTAEHLGIENILTFQLIEKAASHFTQLNYFMNSDLKLAINLSPRQMQDCFCAQQIETILVVNGISADQVIIEITEQYALRTTEQLETLNRLRMLGYGISLDDFGTGFTNLNQLRTLPFTEIKIDRSFITHIKQDKFSQMIVNSLIDVAQYEDVDIVAEGIEYFDEMAYFQRIKESILLQGFLICKPKPYSDIKRWYMQWQKTLANINDN